MNSQPELLSDLLACPNCQKRLRSEIDAFYCDPCAKRYPMEGWITSFFDGRALTPENQAELTAREAFALQYEKEQVQMKGEAFVRYQGDALLRGLRGAPPGSILDAGCGTGSMTTRLGEAGRNIMALDFSLNALKTFRDKKDGCIKVVLKP